MPASQLPQGGPQGTPLLTSQDQQEAVRAFSPCLFCTEEKWTGQATCLECPIFVGTIKRVHQTRKPGCHVDLREAKALEIAARFKLTFQDGCWSVPSQSGESPYRVTLSPNTCTCDDWTLRRANCKHILAAKIVRARDHDSESPAIDTDTLPTRKT